MMIKMFILYSNRIWNWWNNSFWDSNL